MNTPYISIDIETTGLNPDTCQILEIGAVFEDWKTPVNELKTFNYYVFNTPVVGEHFALSMPHNVRIMRYIATHKAGVHILKEGEVVHELAEWLISIKFPVRGESFTPAGKNFGSFDLQFLKRLPGWDSKINVGPSRHRPWYALLAAGGL